MKKDGPWLRIINGGLDERTDMSILKFQSKYFPGATKEDVLQFWKKMTGTQRSAMWRLMQIGLSPKDLMDELKRLSKEENLFGGIQSHQAEPEEKERRPKPRGKLLWHGSITAVQPRVELKRVWGDRYPEYLGYMLRIDGEVDDEPMKFEVAIEAEIQATYELKAGDEVSGKSSYIQNNRLRKRGYDKTTGLEIINRCEAPIQSEPPYLGATFPLDYYEYRNFRRLDAKCYEGSCGCCIWACKMRVTMEKNKFQKRNYYLLETFCFGPKNCKLYDSGPERYLFVDGVKDTLEHESVDERATAHRGEDE